MHAPINRNKLKRKNLQDAFIIVTTPSDRVLGMPRPIVGRVPFLQAIPNTGWPDKNKKKKEKTNPTWKIKDQEK